MNVFPFMNINFSIGKKSKMSIIHKFSIYYHGWKKQCRERGRIRRIIGRG